MVDVDASSYATNDGGGQNLLSKIQQGIGIKNSSIENQLLQQQLQSKQGIAQLYQNAPKDDQGNPDLNYIAQNAGQAGVGAPEALSAALSMQKQKVDLQRALIGQNEDTLSLGKNRNDTITSATLPIVSDIQKAKANGTYDADATRKQLASAYANVIASSVGPDGKPVITPQSAIQHLGSIDFSNPDSVMQELVTKASQAKAMSGHLDEALAIKRGTLGSQQTGRGTQPTSQDIFSGSTSPAGPIIPTGSSFSDGKNQYNTNLVPASNPFSPANAANPNSPPQQALTGSKPSIPGSPQTAVQAAPLTSREAAFMPPNQNNVLPEAPPGYNQNLGTALDRANGVIQHANEVTQLTAPLEGVLKLADKGGPNAALAAKVKGALLDTPLGGLFDNAKDNVAKFEILNKYASDVVGQNMGANASTDLGRSVQALSNPNSSQFPEALRTVAKYLLARTDAAKAYGNYMSGIVADPNVSPAKVVGAENDWRNNFDQNLFEMKHMNEDERKNLIGGMPPKEQQHFLAKAKFLGDQGLLNPEDLE